MANELMCQSLQEYRDMGIKGSDAEYIESTIELLEMTGWDWQAERIKRARQYETEKAAKEDEDEMSL